MSLVRSFTISEELIPIISDDKYIGEVSKVFQRACTDIQVNQNKQLPLTILQMDENSAKVNRIGRQLRNLIEYNEICHLLPPTPEWFVVRPICVRMYSQIKQCCVFQLNRFEF